MLEASGRKLFRSPFPANQPPQNSNSTPDGEQNPLEHDNPIEDVETRETPSLPAPSTPGKGLFRSPFPVGKSLKPPASPEGQTQTPSTGSITDVETKETPALPLEIIADAETKETPALPLQPGADNTIVNAETKDTPALPLQTFYNGAVENSYANNVLPYAQVPSSIPYPSNGPQYNQNGYAPSYTPHTYTPSYNQNGYSQNGYAPQYYPNGYAPSYYPAPVAEQKKGKRAQVSRRKKVILLVLAVALLAPSIMVIFEIINGISLYREAQDGIAQLQAIQAIFHGASGSNSSSGIAAYFDTTKLRQAQAKIDAAHADFVALSNTLDNDAGIGLASNVWSPQVSTLRALGHVAIDGTDIGQILMKTVIDIAPSIIPALQQNPSQTTTTALKPFITPTSYQEINQTLDAIEPLVHDMANYSRGMDINSLPFSTTQRQLLSSILPLLPGFDAGLTQERSLRNEVGWLLGVGQQRSFLIEPMDSAELRASGGFTGQFGQLILNGAHVGPLHLENVGKYEEDHTSEGSPPDPTVYPKVVGQTAPAPYSAWWPVANFGLRDANLSADFPTSARIAMDRYTYEFGQQVDGVIMFTPTLMEQILHVTGPITIPQYHETITEQNLVDRLHYYQLNNTGIRKEEIVEHVEDPQVARKLFTQRVTTTLISTVSHLPLNKLLPMANQMLQSMKSKDLEVYVTNPQIESLIAKYGSTASLDRSNNHDGLFVVQSNLSASKASQYVTTAMNDAITLDAQGGATHHLTMTLDYQQKGDVYGFDTYRDYVRVYVPVNSQLITGNGFDQYDKPFCGDAQSAYHLCQADVYGDGSLVCATPITIGFATAYLNDPYAGADHPLDVTGQPTNLQSDETGRAMFGGWVVIPKNCTMKVTLSWYVPPAGQHPYNLLLQEQSSVYGPLDITIQPDPKTCLPSQGSTLHFSKVMNGADLNFTVKQQGSKCSLISN